MAADIQTINLLISLNCMLGNLGVSVATDLGDRYTDTTTSLGISHKGSYSMALGSIFADLNNI